MTVRACLCLVIASLALVACGGGPPTTVPCALPGGGAPGDDAGSAMGGAFTVGAMFAEFYDAHGGARVFGAPIGPAVEAAGGWRQDFENARLAFDPDALPGRQVRLTPLLVLRARQADPPVAPPADDRLAAYYPATGHTVRDHFLSFYEGYGGAPVFGYPLTEVVNEGGRQVQYFQYAVLYWDPDARPGARVRLAPLGCMALYPALSWWDETPLTFPGGVEVSGPFRDFFETYGGEAVFGPPLGDAQIGADGVLAQTFQNVRMELHHAAAGPRVRLTPLGAAVAPAGHPPEATQEGRCFAETGFCLVYDFLDFYDAHGGEAVFGVPRTPLFYDPEAGALVQYLDGARFEWDTAQQGVHLSPLGRWLVAGRIPGYGDAGGD